MGDMTVAEYIQQNPQANNFSLNCFYKKYDEVITERDQRIAALIGGMALASISLCYAPAVYFEPKIFAYSVAGGFALGAVISIAKRIFFQNIPCGVKVMALYAKSWVVLTKPGVLTYLAINEAVAAAGAFGSYYSPFVGALAGGVWNGGLIGNAIMENIDKVRNCCIKKEKENEPFLAPKIYDII